MYVYNVTLSVDKDVAEAWLAWMKQEHIPEVMQTGCFVDSQMFKILNVDDEGETYSIQYIFKTMEIYEHYKNNYAPELQKKVTDRFSGKFVAFRTLLEVM